MKRILLVTNMYPSMKYPHYGVFVKHTKSILEGAGYSVKVISEEKVDNKINAAL